MGKALVATKNAKIEGTMIVGYSMSIYTGRFWMEVECDYLKSIGINIDNLVGHDITFTVVSDDNSDHYECSVNCIGNMLVCDEKQTRQFVSDATDYIENSWKW